MDKKISEWGNEERKSPRKSPLQPLMIAIILVLGIFIGTNLDDNNSFQITPTGTPEDPQKFVRVLNYIDEHYVDSVQKNELMESAIKAMLEDLDPHSYYISSEELASMQEPLEGNFEGIGVEFMIQRDTLMVVTAIEGGPSEKAGIAPGDRIIEVDGENIAGIELTNQKVMKLLKGEKGSVVTLGIKRLNSQKIIPFEIVRDRIPIHSVVASFLVNQSVGYVKVSRFARNTYEEFYEAVMGLKDQGADQLIIDLRGNGGGYLTPATRMVEEFLEEGKLIVYTEGKASPRERIYSSKKGDFRKMNVVVLINQGSASASEIMAGALQDQDRSITVGRRSFGKGLVQNEIPLPDHSALRLTVARYYTPTGRCIQKPYGKDVDYHNDFNERYENGELMSADSIQLPDSLKYYTPGGRTVYGGGGIMPDVFVGLDTVGSSFYLNQLTYSNVFRQFAFDYVEKNKVALEKYKVWDEFIVGYHVTDGMIAQLVKLGEKEGIAPDAEGLKTSRDVIKVRLKANIGKNLFDENMYYRMLLEDDNIYRKALEVAGDYTTYSELAKADPEL